LFSLPGAGAGARRKHREEAGMPGEMAGPPTAQTVAEHYRRFCDRGRWRPDDGRGALNHVTPAESRFLRHGPGDVLVHGLQNAGITPLRFVAVELPGDAAS
jgi:hypothetical protein